MLKVALDMTVIKKSQDVNNENEKERHLYTQHLLVEIFGLRRAYPLSYIHYWSVNPTSKKIIHESHTWIPANGKYVKDWAETFKVEERTIYKVIDYFIDFGIVKKCKIGRDTYLRIDYKKFGELFNDRRVFNPNSKNDKPHMLLQDDGTIKCEIAVVAAVGLHAATLLKQIGYKSNNENLGEVIDGKKWYYETQEKLAKLLNVSVSSTKTYISKLVNAGLIEVHRGSSGYKRPNYYWVNEKASSALQNLTLVTEKSDSSNCKNWPFSITKTNTEINTKNNIYIDDSQNKERAPKVVSSSSDDYGQLAIKISKKTKSERFLLEIALNMFRIWNDTVGQLPSYQYQVLPPTKWFIWAWKNKFIKNIECWRNYCESIATSPYLSGLSMDSKTGKRFVLTLGWALSKEIIDKIRAGKLGVKRKWLDEIITDRTESKLTEVATERTLVKHARKRGELALVLQMRNIDAFALSPEKKS